MKRRLTAAALAGMLLCTTACSTTTPSANSNVNPAGTGERIQISMCLWDKSMTKELTPWLEEQFPNIEFSFIVGYNTMAYYADLNTRSGGIPDIISCRRFSLNDASLLSDQLMDLSQTEVVGTFYDSYIENNREADGAIRWLPMCAEVDGYMANLDLFEEHNIPIPTNYQEFVAAIDAFEALGIEGVATDWNADYTCLESLQGSAIPVLMSLEGTTWRRSYESEDPADPVGLDETVWPQVFDTFARYLTDIRVQPNEAKRVWAQVTEPFFAGQTAIMRCTANDCKVVNDAYGINCAMLPYFGETAEDNWILTYPLCQLAVNKNVEQDPAKQEAVMQVLGAIFSQEGQLRLAAGSAVLSYNKTVNLEMGDALLYVQDCIEHNHMYMRLASTEMFAISKDVVQKMIAGGYGSGFNPDAAYQDFNQRVLDQSAAEPGEVLITQNTAYDYSIADTGNPAASSMMNTIRSGSGDEIGIGYSNVVSSPVFEGDYTEQQLKWFMGFKTVAYQAEYTGEEIQRLMEWLVNVKEDGSNPIRHKNNIPVTSGMEYSMKDNGDGTYTLESVTVNGQPLEAERTYKVVLLGEDNYLEASLYCNAPMPEDLKEKRVQLIQEGEEYNSYNVVIATIKKNGQLEAPTKYVTIH